MGTPRHLSVGLQVRIVEVLHADPRRVKAHHRVVPNQLEEADARLVGGPNRRGVGDGCKDVVLLVFPERDVLSAMHLPSARTERVAVRLSELDDVEGVWIA